MNFDIINIIKKVFLIYLMASSLYSHSQDSTYKFTIDTSYFNIVFSGRVEPEFNFIFHSPEKSDSGLYKSHRYLINEIPNDKNHVKYFKLACSIWELEKIDEAEKMFLKIVESGNKNYSTTYSHSSDVPGDTTSNLYGYGSFTSNYKNPDCIYLTKIYIEKKKFSKALSYLEKAVKNYKVTYSCGTGFSWQQDSYRFYYATCYDGLGRYENVIQLLLPDCLNWDDKLIIRAIKKLFTQDQITQYLTKAEKSITCSVDTIQSFSYVTSNYGKEDQKTDTLRYYSGSGTIILFNKQINLPNPNLKDGEILTKEYYVNLFKESAFYKYLFEIDKISYR
jgi:tetratricopeptide (TPR) repeat protein